MVTWMSSSNQPARGALSKPARRWRQTSRMTRPTYGVRSTTFSSQAALAFVYFRFPLKSLFFAAVLFALTLPTELLIVALFDLVSGDLKWANSYAAIIVPFIASATGVLLFRQHFMNIPSSLSDAARKVVAAVKPA